MSVEGFRGPQVCKIVGITYRQLDYWARTGLLKPSLSEANGSGTQRLYAYQDLLRLKVIKQLLDSGISLRSAKKAIACLQDSVGVDLASAKLVMSSSRSVLAETDDAVVDLLKGGQGVFNVMPLNNVVDDLNEAIVSLGNDDDGLRLSI